MQWKWLYFSFKICYR